MSEVWWTKEREASLRALWVIGLSTQRIGERLGTTKNAVIGKVHRLGLTPRVIIRRYVPVSQRLMKE